MNCKTMLCIVFIAVTTLNAPSVHAEGWCPLVSGWTVVTHGTKADNVFLLAQLVGSPSAIWIQISDSTVGKANVAIAIGAQLAGRNLSIYLDTPGVTCANFASWSPMGAITHIQLN